MTDVSTVAAERIAKLVAIISADERCMLESLEDNLTDALLKAQEATLKLKLLSFERNRYLIQLDRRHREKLNASS